MSQAYRPLLQVLLLLIGAGAGGPELVSAARAEPVLERVVLVQRHGVRAPTQSSQLLESWTARPWPIWPVASGELTDQGADVVALVADGIRAHYVERGLLPAKGCPGDGLVVWADSRDERTRRSGEQMAAHLAPGCSVSAASGTPGTRDPLFKSAEGACRFEPGPAADALREAIGPGGKLAGSTEPAIADIFSILKPGAPAPDPAASRFEVDPYEIVLTGPLAVAADTGEIFLLEYAQGFASDDVAWGAAPDAARFASWLGPRNRLSDLTRALPYAAVRQGGAMARFMIESLALEPRAAAPAIGESAKLIALAGHDDNLSNMAGVFGADWTLPGQPDETAPATAFALERWREPTNGDVWVRLTLFYAELEGMRALDPKAVHALSIALPGCGGRACPLEQVRARVHALVPEACRG
ncbi:MAG: histidine-type phosphatase [Pseudomonadota bacterium]